MSGIAIPPTAFAIRLFGQTAAGNFQLPSLAGLRQIYARSTNANAVTGGLKFGTTVGGVDILAALAMPGNSMVSGAPLITAIQTGARTISFDAVTLWNGASVDICAVYDQAF